MSRGFMLHGGQVLSRHDGQRHFVRARELEHLYGLDRIGGRTVCLIDDDNEDRLRGLDLGQYVHLYPRPDGDYREYLAALLSDDLS